MYQKLRKHYWWNGMEADIAKYASRCLICQQVKAEHQKPTGMLRPLEILRRKWEYITIDFVEGLPKTSSGHDAI